MEAILKAENISIRYITGDFKDIGLKEYVVRKLSGNYKVKEFMAVDGVSFELEKGDMLGIVGSNGAGKSTLLKAIAGIMVPTHGEITADGEVVALLELGSGFDGDLTVKENAYLRGAMLGYTRRFMDETYEQIIDFAELRDFEDRPFKQLSSGMKSRLAFSIASMVNPDILILDEVLSVGDGAFQEKSAKKMREIISGGATTILVSHSLKQIRELCNKILWLDHGRQIAFGKAEEICDRYERFLHGEEPLPIVSNAIYTPKKSFETTKGKSYSTVSHSPKISQMRPQKCLNALFAGILSILFSLGVFTGTNPIWGYAGVDCAAFILIGRGMLNGKIPYRDLADNKGLVLYGINALGQSFFSGKIYDIFGIWLIELVLLFVSLVLIGKMAKKLHCRSSVFFQVFYLLIILPLVERGNMSEEYSNFLIIVSFYLCIQYLLEENRRHLWKYGFLFGASFFLSFFMRPNNALPIAGIVLVLTIYLIVDRNWKELFIHAGFFALGTLIVCLPMGLYLLVNNALYDCFLFTILANLGYSNVSGKDFWQIAATAYGKMAFAFLSFTVIGVLLHLAFSQIKRKDVVLCCTVVLSALLSFFSAFLSGYTFMHYLLIGSVPFLLGMMILAGEETERKFCKKYFNCFRCVTLIGTFVWTLSVMGSSLQVAYSNLANAQRMFYEYNFRTGSERQTVLLELAEKIPSEKKDSVMFIEDGATQSTDLYVQMRLLPCERLFICQNLFTSVSSQINMEFQKYLADPPDFLLSTVPLEDVDGPQSVLSEKYILIDQGAYGIGLYERYD